MSELKRKKNSNKKILFFSILVFVLACAIVAGVCLKYYSEVKDTVKNESKDYMLEISTQMANNISRNINDNFSALQTLAVSLQDTADSFEGLAEKVKDLKQYWQYDKILVIDGNAMSYDENNMPVRLNNDQYLQDVIVSKKISMSASETIADVESVIFAVPVDFTVGGKKIVALAATYKLDTFDKILSMSAFDGKAYAHIIRADGTLVIHSSAENVFETGYNILNTIEKATGSQKSEFERVRAAIRDSVSGFLEFNINGESLYMTYVSLDESIDSGDWRLITFVPLSVVNVKSMVLLRFTLLLCGFISAAFIILCVVILVVNLKNRRRLETVAYVDDVTGGNTIKYFNEVTQKTLSHAQNSEYAIIFINLEKFKVLNEQYGRDKCDRLLVCLNRSISENLDADECIGRQYADNFCALVKFSDQRELLNRIKVWKASFFDLAEQAEIGDLPFIIEFGVYVAEDAKVPLNLLIDRAKLSLTETNPVLFDNIRLSIYNEDMRRKLVREKYLEDMMEASLASGEFQVYLQPKYCTATEAIGGAEALVRWNSEKEGLIFPGEFIPLFEKNGFIKKLDTYVFEDVCKMLKRWLGKGYAPLKVSVNCSREHLKDKTFLADYIEIADRYNVPHGCLEIEFTENIVFEDIGYFSHIINEIHAAGFGCSMDDFGSGYSSLSMIQDIPVDTIKLDKIFFYGRSNNASSRTESIVASIINMSKSLSITTVAEGVEGEDQVRMLQRLGCDMIQGYYFAKPMPVEEFEKIAFTAPKDGEGDTE